MANWATACIVRAIQEMGLEVSSQKTEAIFFHDGSHGTPPESHIKVEGVRIPVGSFMKYLSLTLDGRWGFERHFELLAPKAGRLATTLSRFLPKLSSPRALVRRLYTNTVQSVSLYGAPV